MSLFQEPGAINSQLFVAIGNRVGLFASNSATVELAAGEIQLSVLFSRFFPICLIELLQALCKLVLVKSRVEDWFFILSARFVQLFLSII